MADVLKEELKKQAQTKLAEARSLIREAGELAKQGQFILHFGEIGTFIPRSALDRDLLKTEALEILQRDGRYNGYDKIPTGKKTPWGSDVYDYKDRPSTPYTELSQDEIEVELEKLVDDLIGDSEIPSEFREYHSAEDADKWWHPSRC